ncbi:hypothetical protein ATO6_02755 [Oceanicola sp. 22II-s10i]|uniref:hypothetical protein n=1 Tax=Oceanicola sp. 22II-s10i TaxID=1317116 RepID=UPI000B51EF89|nr:hypothetical protein [Oceanicola sp. 22II-s10i]OWU85838.1 hypothetical protein ATO6_02755 [Oceanicola sp. 22II-s10i]
MIAGFVMGASILGLAVFAALVREEPRGSFFRGLGAGLVVLVLAGLALLRLLPPPETGGHGRVLTGLALLWFAWIFATAFVAQAFRRRFPQSSDWLMLAGGLTTLAPATGLVVALWMM